ncbi:MAG: Two-component system response regulator [Gemmatimonadetes bacterium]|jgi:two-component system alkaline phosphatase synthesis response regulator PhoP|nr:Two-component system response regulator [Gemmatimonadota bacterium]
MTYSTLIDNRHSPSDIIPLTMPRILIVEDNPDLAYGLRTGLEIEGYDVQVAEDGETGLDRARAWTPDLVMLDLMLPGMDGYRVLRTLREGGSDVPVLILTARGEEADKVLGFRLGADDYVTKPCGVLELLARVGALLRRSRIAEHRVGGADALERFGSVDINPASRTVTKEGTPVALSPKEFDLLLALVRRRGAVASRVELLREVWGHRVEVMTRTVDIHIAELRRKLEDDPSQPRHILTVWKAGYRLEP